MKTIYLVALFMLFGSTYAQSEKTLDETKSYIVRMINEYAWEHNSSTKRLHAEFDGNLLKITLVGKSNGRKAGYEPVYDFTNVYKFKGPLREPGNIGRILFWVDYRVEADKWKKERLDIDIHNYDVGVELMTAFRHLNKLLKEAKPGIEKF